MIAKVTSAEKKTLPQFDAEANQDVLKLMVVCHVQFIEDDGVTVHYEQDYAMLPEQFDPENPAAVFQKQADVMQGDIEGKVKNEANEASAALADDIISKLTE